MVVQEPVVIVGDLTPARLASLYDLPALVTSDSVAENQSGIESSIVSQVKSLFASFAESVEARFSSVDQCFSLVISSFASTDSHSRVDVGCQDAITNRSLTTPVAVRSEHPPDRAPSTSYSDDLGTTLKRVGCCECVFNATSFPHMSFADLMTTVQYV